DWLEDGLPPLPTLRVAVANAEPLHAHQRELVARAFGCPARESYGQAEAVAAASECPAGTLHTWPEVGVLEVWSEGAGARPLPAGEAGQLVATGLLNRAMPLVRYAVGDRAALAGDTTPCACGRALPRLLELSGRCDDVLLTPDGRRVGRLD